MPDPKIGTDGWRCAVTDPPDTDRLVEVMWSDHSYGSRKLWDWSPTYPESKCWQVQIAGVRREGELPIPEDMIAWRDIP